MADILFRPIGAQEIDMDLFAHFDRTQVVRRCWRREDGRWILREVPFVDQWDQKDYLFLVDCLQNTLETGGAVLGAFDGGRLTGFASVESVPLGPHGQYLQLSSLHVSREARGQGIGGRLFRLACDAALERGAQKLYISAHSAEETQAFYRAIGCVEAGYTHLPLVELEPCDCQLEYVLGT